MAAAKVVITMSVLKLHSRPTFDMMVVLPEGLTSTVTAVSTQKSSLPLSGSFKAICTDSFNKDWETGEIPFNVSVEAIDFEM